MFAGYQIKKVDTKQAAWIPNWGLFGILGCHLATLVLCCCPNNQVCPQTAHKQRISFCGKKVQTAFGTYPCCCCWFTPPLPWDGGMARTAIQVHAINLIKLGQGKTGNPFRTSSGCKLPTGSPTNKADYHWWVPKSRLLQHAG